MTRNLICRALSLVATLFAFAPPALANDQLIEMAKNPKNWVMPLGNYAGHRYSALDQINENNVSKLQVAWMFSTGVLRGHEGSPLVIGDMMYLVTPFPNEVIALNLAAEGKIVWRYTPKQDEATVVKRMCCDTVNRGLAYSDGMLFMQQADTKLVAIDEKTGKEVWSVINGDPKKGETGVAAPLYVKNKLIAGISGGEFGARCHLTAYEVTPASWVKPQTTTKLAWRAYTAGPDSDILFDPEKTTSLGKPVGKDSSLASWQGEDWKTSGGCATGWITYDPELNLIYYGTGNPAPWNPKQRPGDNKWTASIIARDADTGIARWVYQATPHDEWDYDATAEGILVDLPVAGGSPRKALVQFNKNGLVYALDRATGELISADKFELKTNWTKGVELNPVSTNFGRPIIDPKHSPDIQGQDINTKGICPSAMGAKGMAPAAWSPQDHLFVVPTNHRCMDYEPFKVSFSKGEPYVGATLSMFPAPDSHGGMGNLVAWDAISHKIAWMVPEEFSLSSGVLTTKGGVVFYGTQDGHFKAVQLATGKLLYKFKIGSGVIGNVFTYEHQRRQYVAVLSGINSWRLDGLNPLPDPCGQNNCMPGPAGPMYPGLKMYTNLGGTLTVFALPDDVARPKPYPP